MSKQETKQTYMEPEERKQKRQNKIWRKKSKEWKKSC